MGFKSSESPNGIGDGKGYSSRLQKTETPLRNSNPFFPTLKKGESSDEAYLHLKNSNRMHSDGSNHTSVHFSFVLTNDRRQRFKPCLKDEYAADEHCPATTDGVAHLCALLADR